MARGKKKTVIDTAHPHTIKKFELIEEYIKSWSQKLMLYENCNTLVFIDCMCNSGVYFDDDGNLVDGTSVLVANVLLNVARKYPSKMVQLYLNDINKEKVEELRKHIPANERNFQIITTDLDAGALLRTIGPQLYNDGHLHYFLLYDPYDATIDWAALIPFFRNWGEVMINHMVSDPVRAITSAKRQTTKEKYENTYLEAFAELVPYGSNKQAYEKRVEEIIEALKGPRNYYVSAFPFYNSQNSQVYSLVHCTSNREGFKLYKKSAWKVFGDQSSTKKTHGEDGQLVLNLDPNVGSVVTTSTDESCFTVHDITKYLQKSFSGRKGVHIEEMWALLDEHPIFPSSYRNQIKQELVEMYGATKEQVVDPFTGKKETVISFR